MPVWKTYVFTQTENLPVRANNSVLLNPFECEKFPVRLNSLDLENGLEEQYCQ